MPEKYYEKIINEITKIIVFFETESGRVANFVVKLLLLVGDNWKELQRYDCYHKVVHKDVFNKNGKKISQKRFELVDAPSGLTMAIEDFTENYNVIIWRYLNDQK